MNNRKPTAAQQNQIFQDAVALHQSGQLDLAEIQYKKLLSSLPNNILLLNNLAGIAFQRGNLEEGIKTINQSLRLVPNQPDTLNNRGNALKGLKQFDRALESYDQAIAFKPDHIYAHFNRGNVLKDLNRLEEVVESYDRAIVLNPNIECILGDTLLIKMRLAIWNNFQQLLDEIIKKIKNHEKALTPFTALLFVENLQTQRKSAELFAKETYHLSSTLPKLIPHPKHNKIRIAYFSADFRNHPIAFLTAELYEMHDRNKFEIYAFSFYPKEEDQMTTRIKAGVDHFYDISKMFDKDVVELVRSLEIDIAVDLGGYTQYARTALFAMRLAPIQINYLGYPGTMDAPYIDYIIADKILIPQESQKYYSEKIVYLPNSYQVNDSKRKISDKIYTRKELGLPEKGFVYCCFNNSYKITPQTFDGWMRILKAVEGSVLWLFEDNTIASKNLQKEAEKRGINSNRLIFAKRLPPEEHLARHKCADLFIDTLPYNAHTTCSDALWTGLPVLTLIGQSFAARVAASLLNAVNLPELITTTQEEYEKTAIELATNPEKLKIIKDKLINNLPTSPLYNTKLFTQNIESAYTNIYDRYHDGLDPDYIYTATKDPETSSG